MNHDVRELANRMIKVLNQRLRAGAISPEEHLISIGEVIRWARKHAIEIEAGGSRGDEIAAGRLTASEEGGPSRAR
jgi:hypothetical protein